MRKIRIVENYFIGDIISSIKQQYLVFLYFLFKKNKSKKKLFVCVTL